MVDVAEVTPWEHLKGINVDSMERLAKLISSTTLDGEAAFGRAGYAAGQELMEWVAHRRQGTKVRKVKAKKKKEKEDIDPMRQTANKVTTYCEDSYREAFDAPLTHRTNWYGSSTLIYGLLKQGYSDEKLAGLWDRFLECGKEFEEADNKFIYRSGTISDFKLAIGRLEAMSAPKENDNIVPLSFAAGGE